MQLSLRSYLSNPGTWRESCQLSAKAHSYTLKCNIDTTRTLTNPHKIQIL